MAKRHSTRTGHLELLFLRLEELVLANSGEDEFEEIFKLLIAKLWDERNQPGQFRDQGVADRTAAAINNLLQQAVREWPGVLDESNSRLTPGHLAICVDALSRHTLSEESLEVLDGFFEFLVARGTKGAKGQFFTPRPVVELCVRMLRPMPEETVLDPACGSGGFLIHTLNHIRSTAGGNGRPPDLWGFDFDGRTVRVARALLMLAGADASNIVRTNSLIQPQTSRAVQRQADSSTIESVCASRIQQNGGFDVILTNPPFAGDVRERQLLDRYHLAQGKPRVERDILFLERCVNLLRPGGRMAIVLPQNKFSAAAYGSLREWLLRETRVLAVVGLGRHTFLPHTHQKACVLLLRKPLDGKQTQRDYEIFFAVSERDGKDSKGQFIFKNGSTGSIWERVDHDLDAIAAGFDSFCEAEGVWGE